MTDSVYVGIGLAQAMSLFMSVIFICYVATIVVPYARRKPGQPGSADQYDWHFVIPARDEASVIGNTVDTLRDRFPQAHVWVVDDASLDDTALIVDALAEGDDRVHLVLRRLPEARTGKGDALNTAYDALNAHLQRLAATGVVVRRDQVVIGVIDADGIPAHNCLDVISADHLFGRPEVGAVQICVRMLNRNELRPFPDKGQAANAFGRMLVRLQDLEFRGPISAIQLVRQRTHTVGLGGNGQFARLSALDVIAASDGRPWHGSLLEDYELSLHLLMAGFTNEYTMDTLVDQEGLPNPRRLLTQRTRWGQGTMQCGSYLPAIWTSRNVTTVGALEASYYLIQPWLQLVGSLLYPIPFVVVAYNIHKSPQAMGQFFVHGGWMLAVIYLVLGLAPFVLWGPLYAWRCEPSIGRVRAIGLGFAYALYTMACYNITCWRALIRIVGGRSGWAKTRRNTDVRSGPVALEA